MKTLSMFQAVINGLNKAGMALFGEEKKPFFFDEERAKSRQNRIDITSLTNKLLTTNCPKQKLIICYEVLAEPFLKEDYSVPIFIDKNKIDNMI